MYKMNTTIVDAPIFRSDFKQFIQQHSNKHIIVYASATWCSPCKKIKPIIYNYFEHYTQPNKLLVLLDIDRCRDVANALRIRGVPQLMYYRSGEPLYVTKGGSVSGIQSFFQKLDT